MTNAAAIGYMIRAAKQAGYDEKDIHLLEHLMYKEMDLVCEDDAESTYNHF